MNKQQQKYFEKAIEQADGFSAWSSNMDVMVDLNGRTIGTASCQHVLDALAAQLARQIDASKTNEGESYWLEVEDTGAAVCTFNDWGNKAHVCVCEKFDRTWNTIIVAVDSKLLEK